MIHPKYRKLASNESYLDEFTNLMMFVFKFTKTKGAQGGRGTFFMSLVTEKIVRHIMLSISKVLFKFLESATNYDTDPEEEAIKSIFTENKHFSMQSFYKKADESNYGIDKIENNPEVACEKSPWDWANDYFSDPKIFKNDYINLMTNNWFSQTWDSFLRSHSEKEFDNPWNIEGRLNKNAPAKIALFIRQGIMPQGKTIYLLLAIYREIGFDIPIFSDEQFVHDIVGLRLEAFCRMYIGTVLHKYFCYNSASKKYYNREQILNALNDKTKGLVFVRGNHNSSKWTRDDSETEKEKTGVFNLTLSHILYQNY